MVKPKTVFVLLLIVLPFLFLTFDIVLASLYSMFTAGIIFLHREFKGYPLAKGKWFDMKMLIIAGASFFVFLAMASVLTQTSGMAALSTQGVLDYQAQFIPPLAESPMLKLFTYGFLIPIIETWFFFGLVFFYAEKILKTPKRFTLKSKKSLMDHRMWILFGVVSAVFLIFHITSKSGDRTLLLITGVFALVSVMLVKYYGELRHAIMLHIVNNTAVMLVVLNLLKFSAAPGVG